MSWSIPCDRRRAIGIEGSTERQNVRALTMRNLPGKRQAAPLLTLLVRRPVVESGDVWVSDTRGKRRCCPLSSSAGGRLQERQQWLWRWHLCRLGCLGPPSVGRIKAIAVVTAKAWMADRQGIVDEDGSEVRGGIHCLSVQVTRTVPTPGDDGVTPAQHHRDSWFTRETHGPTRSRQRWVGRA